MKKIIAAIGKQSISARRGEIFIATSFATQTPFEGAE
jgi:hypothetical protein